MAVTAGCPADRSRAQVHGARAARRGNSPAAPAPPDGTTTTRGRALLRSIIDTYHAALAFLANEARWRASRSRSRTAHSSLYVAFSRLRRWRPISASNRVSSSAISARVRGSVLLTPPGAPDLPAMGPRQPRRLSHSQSVGRPEYTPEATFRHDEPTLRSRRLRVRTRAPAGRPELARLQPIPRGSELGRSRQPRLRLAL